MKSFCCACLRTSRVQREIFSLWVLGGLCSLMWHLILVMQKFLEIPSPFKYFECNWGRKGSQLNFPGRLETIFAIISKQCLSKSSLCSNNMRIKNTIDLPTKFQMEKKWGNHSWKLKVVFLCTGRKVLRNAILRNIELSCGQILVVKNWIISPVASLLKNLIWLPIFRVFVPLRSSYKTEHLNEMSSKF